MNIDLAALIRAHQAALLESIEGYGKPRLSSATRTAWMSVERHHFLERYRNYGDTDWQYVTEDNLWRHLPMIYRDSGLGIFGADDDDVVATISSPSFVAYMLDQLMVEPGMRVLEIGAGSGFNAALLGRLTGPAGQVDSVEIIPELAESARRGLKRADIENVSIICGDAGAALEHQASYDRVIFTAGSYDLPAFLYGAVKDGGLLELVLRCPGGGDVLIIFRKSDGAFVSQTARDCEFVPLTGRGRMKELDAIAIDDFDHPPPIEERPFSMTRTFPLRSYLAIVEPRMRWFFEGFGLWDEPSRSLALVREGRITIHGGKTAGIALADHFDQWCARGFPSMSTMRVRAVPSSSSRDARDGEWRMSRPSTDFFWGT